jgi:hypothetical protein
MSSISHTSASIAANAVNPGSSSPLPPAALVDGFRPGNLSPSAHPAMRELSISQLGEAGRLAGRSARPVR